MFKRIVAIVAVVIFALTGAAAYSLFRTPEAASGPLQAIPVTLAQATATQALPENSAGAEVAAAQTITATAGAREAQSVAGSTGAEDETAAQPAAPILFEIRQAESQARFVINEVLRGRPTVVVGVTDQVAGQIAVDPANPANVQVGIIQVNARTLATDNAMRNRAVKNIILQTDAYELVTFAPSAVNGLPADIEIGATYSFQITGDLTIKNVTRPVTFDVSVTPISTSRLEGAASATILYRDFELFIPDSPSVDTVADEVRLELDFVAEAAA